MSEKAGWGKTVLGWIVVQDEPDADSAGASKGAAGSDADALIAKYADPPAPMPVKLEGPLPTVQNGTIDFAQVYQAAGIGPGELSLGQKALGLIAALPQDTPAPVKKQIVEASLRAFDVPTDKIIEASAQQLQALEAFVRSGQSDVQKVITEGNARVQALQDEMAQVKLAMEQAVAEQGQRTSLCNGEKHKIQELLEFFGQAAVARVVEESPKLFSPQH